MFVSSILIFDEAVIEYTLPVNLSFCFGYTSYYYSGLLLIAIDLDDYFVSFFFKEDEF